MSVHKFFNCIFSQCHDQFSTWSYQLKLLKNSGYHNSLTPIIDILL